MNGDFPITYSVDPESTGQKPHDQIDNLIDSFSLSNLLSFLIEPAPGINPWERMKEEETIMRKIGHAPEFLMGLGLLASSGGKVRKTATKLGSRRVLKELGEEVADPLYHNTSPANLLDILKEGHLKGSPALGRKHLPSKEGSGISFTRNPRLGTGEAKGTPGERLFQTKYGQAQIMVSKEGIENLGKITKHGPKEFSQEVLFSPLKSETKRVQRLPKISTEKFEGIHISEFMGETQLSGREYDKEIVSYITELMKNAHKRKVPIILGPEATETFYKLGMDKKLPKTWQGRLVTDRTVSVGRTQLTEPTKKAVGATPRDLRQKLEILDRSQNLGINKKTDKRFWAIVVDPLDGNIEYTIPYSKAYTAEFHHSKYMPEHLAKEVESGEKILMYFHKGLRHIRGPVRDDLFRRRYIPMVYDHRTGRSVVGVGVNEKLGVDLIPWEYHYGAQVDQKLYDKIYEQIEILPSPKSKLPGP